MFVFYLLHDSLTRKELNAQFYENDRMIDEYRDTEGKHFDY